MVLLQLAAPGCALIAAPEPAAADVRTGDYVCGSPEATLAGLASLEMCRSYGLPTQSGGLGGDARYPDFQEGAEGVVPAVLTALAGADSMVGFGTLDGAQTFSLADAVLDNDVVAGMRRLLGEHPVDRAASLVDDILAVGPGGHFLSRRSTRAALRAGEVWEPAVFRRGHAEGDPKALVQEAAARAAELLEAHQPSPLDDGRGPRRRRRDRTLREDVRRRVRPRLVRSHLRRSPPTPRAVSRRGQRRSGA